MAIIQKKSLRRHHQKKNHREEIIEGKSWRRNHGGEIMEEK